jgi:hypothetical protein
MGTANAYVKSNQQATAKLSKPHSVSGNQACSVVSDIQTVTTVKGLMCKAPLSIPVPKLPNMPWIQLLVTAGSLHSKGVGKTTEQCVLPSAWENQ